MFPVDHGVAAIVGFVSWCATVTGALHVVDLTHDFNERTHHWPAGRGFKLEKAFAGKTSSGFFYAINNYEQAEHVGTHVDAPYHFSEERWTSADIPIQRMVARGVIVDVSKNVAAATPDYQLSVKDLQEHEIAHGIIPAETIVLINFGWSKRWGDYESYFGTPTKDVSLLHFPGISPEAATYLVQRRVYGVGLDTPSTDYGQSKDFKTHQVFGGSNVFAIENVANLDALPADGGTGAITIHAAVQKISGGTGGPVRIYAVIDDGNEPALSLTASEPTTVAALVVAVVLLAGLNIFQAVKAGKKSKAM